LLVSILDAIVRQDDAEVTVECNPDTVTSELLDAYAAAGVNRLSFGVQSMAPSVLASLGRTHDIDNVHNAIDAAKRAGFTTWNVDLIYGAAGESVADWEHTLDAVLALDPPHVSAYALTVEAGTPLAADPARFPDDDDQATKYLIAESAFTGAGLESYEISNWARPGHECRHNLLYWDQSDYRGIGCAAHSHEAGRRWWNMRTPDRYIAAVERGESTIGGVDELDAEGRRVEALQLSVRTRRGVPVGALSRDDRIALDGLVVEDRERLRLTPAGRLLANEVAVRLR
jgi:oxygen-independent coproporphyrinogen-3 oxidase